MTGVGAEKTQEGLKLLPRENTEFASEKYWDDFFHKLRENKGEGSGFEWYGTWKEDLRGLVKAEMGAQTGPETLVVGCGNSTLSQDMFVDGFPKVTSVDFSQVVIDEMKPKEQPGLEYVLMDMLNMDASYGERFDVVFDKGALDALMTDNSDAVHELAVQFGKEIIRVLKSDGYYFCVTLAQTHIIKFLYETFCEGKGNSVHIYPFEPKSGSVLLPFLVAVRKGSAAPECKIIQNKQEEVLGSLDQLLNIIEDRRLVYHMQRRIRISEEGLRGKFTLHGPDASLGPRYFVSVVDSGLPRKDQVVPCGVFIVPQGREYEWTFSSEDGQLQTAKGNRIGRLVVVSMGRGHEFDSIKAVQEELSPNMLPLTPIDIPLNTKIPFMTTESGLGARNIVATISSKMGGEMVVEDVQLVDDDTNQPVVHRRLIFMNNIDVIQSEGRLLTIKQKQTKKNNKKKTSTKKTKVIDPTFLAFEFHRAMVAGMFFVPSIPEKICIVGLGSGALVSYLTNAEWKSENLSVDVVELDPEVVNVAKDYFNFPSSKDEGKTSVHVMDGVKFLMESSETKYDVLVLDVDSKDLSQPVQFPPLEFLETSFLEHLKTNKLLSQETGMLILNLACRSSPRRTEILTTLKSIFPFIACMPLEIYGDTNYICFCFVNAEPSTTNLEDLMSKAKTQLRSGRQGADFCEIIDQTKLVTDDGLLV